MRAWVHRGARAGRQASTFIGLAAGGLFVWAKAKGKRRPGWAELARAGQSMVGVLVGMAASVLFEWACMSAWPQKAGVSCQHHAHL